MKPPHIIHLASPPGEIQHKDITVYIDPQQPAPLWEIIESQVQRFSILRICPYCHGYFEDSPHNPAARVDCWHSQCGSDWITTDVVCQRCYSDLDLLTGYVQVFFNQHSEGDIEIVHRDWITGDIRVFN